MFKDRSGQRAWYRKMLKNGHHLLAAVERGQENNDCSITKVVQLNREIIPLLK